MTTGRSLDIQVKRVHDATEPDDGSRVLVDRLWPRGISKDRAALDAWEKELAPSTELRQWYDHDPAKFDAFAERYRRELDDADRAADLDRLRGLARSDRLTLLTATKDLPHGHVRVLADVLRSG
ncbi:MULTISPECIES: DUF488 domain-containing protein [unclassified Streptomyces]|uniref:DUF488 domain-containing protein n=1 Tax=unclassified Streptomyces TaxID=2593676 RepID=UPI000749C131|nr:MULTISPECIES: DUF488 family protein [unclassified Streptomyces]KUL61800.1 hypothetical protein ADL30_06480 [Streptomyces sp. NRRL S-1521]THC50077.1 DUF488 family protein [Streptomyces sp. A1499]